jgi:hypothetical protein
MSREKIQHFAVGGVSVVVGSVDAEGIPTCCRGIAIRSKDNYDTITVYISVAAAQETVANVATTHRLAVTCSHPLSHETIQIKGLTRGVRLAPSSDETFVRERLEQFADVLGTIGQPKHITMRISHWPAFAIDVSVEEIYDQTPGPRAGEVLA